MASIPIYYILPQKLSEWIKIPYLHESSAHPFRGFLGPKNQVRIRINNGTLDASKVRNYDFPVGRVVVTCFHSLIVPGEYGSLLCEITVQQQNGQVAQVLLHSKMQAQGDPSCRKRREQTCCMGIFSARE